MEVSKDDFSELEIGTSVESFQKFLVAQKDLFHSQIDELQKIVVTQCKLTGVNPLAQEMAAGALSIKIGKRPRDLLNPKAVNYMQSVFSIKDAITKKESREISALFGVTVTQVREFFTSQRSRVRRLVRVSRERAIRSNTCEEPQDGFLANSDPMRPINPVPLNSVGPASVDEASCSSQENQLHDLDEVDKHFSDNIFNLMRKEETFSGQEKLMEWILKIQNSSVLCWFLDQGGARILVTWLSEAAIEEQTSVLLHILKVLCHLPLHKTRPIHMPALLQSVNRLRFYKTSDISNRARVLLSKWSKLLARNQAAKKLNGVKPSSDAQKESIGQIIGTESWVSTIDVPEDILALTNEGLNNFRKLESSQAVKLLPASSDDINKKHILGVSSSQNRERRKVQLVEQPGQKTVRSPQTTRAAAVSQGRPMSTDDIQKAKMRALFMKTKYGKTASSKENKEAKTDGLHKASISQDSVVASSSKVPISQKMDEDKKSILLPSKISNRLEASVDSNLRLDLKEPTWEKCKRVPILWKTPAEVKLETAWRIGAGENSKEIEVQKNRHRREKETVYHAVHEIPPNPKEPWDREMEYDDSLTPEIPVEQLLDNDGTEAPVANNHGATDTVQMAATSSSSSAEPDLELLAVLLKNPELVFALTSGQAGGLESQDTVKLLDMIKKGGVNLAANVNGKSEKAQEKVEVSLPSPTPSSDPRTTGWRTEAARNPFSRQSLVSDRISHSSPAVASTNSVLSHISVTGNVVTQQPTNMALTSQSQQHASTISSYSLLGEATLAAERQPPLAHSSVHPSTLTNSLTIQTLSSDIGVTMKNIMTANASSVYVSRAHSPLTMRVDSTSNVKPVANLSVQEGMLNSFGQQSRMLPSTTRSGPTSHPQRHPHLLQQSHFSEPSYNNPGSSYQPQIEKPAPIFRQDMSSNYRPQYNHNNYNGMVGGLMQSGNSWERNNHGREGFESWSPENSPTRQQGYYSQRRNVPPESRINPVRNYGPEWSRQPSSSGYWDPSRHGNRKWHDRRR